jgi:hypothetical protein
LIKIKGTIARKLKFWGQLGDKLKKSETKDHIAMVTNFGAPIEGHQGLNCKNLGSIRGSIESN